MCIYNIKLIWYRFFSVLLYKHSCKSGGRKNPHFTQVGCLPHSLSLILKVEFQKWLTESENNGDKCICLHQFSCTIYTWTTKTPEEFVKGACYLVYDLFSLSWQSKGQFVVHVTSSAFLIADYNRLKCTHHINLWCNISNLKMF